jgi:hypothetical protein
MSSIRLAQMCSKPPPTEMSSNKGGSAPAQCSRPPNAGSTTLQTSAAAPATTTNKITYTTVNNWGPVIGRTSSLPCNIERTLVDFSSESVNPEEWKKTMANYEERRQDFSKFNQDEDKGNTVIGTNDRQPNHETQYACQYPDVNNCLPVLITEDGTLSNLQNAEHVVCLGNGDEIIGVENISSESECSQQCDANNVCAGYTFTGGQCILQNSLLLTQNPGYILGQHSLGVSTRIKHCSFESEGKNSVCIPKKDTEKNCFRTAGVDALPITSCPGTLEEGLQELKTNLQALDPFEFNTKTMNATIPGTPPPANDSSIMPVYEKK